jgi:uncharacterized RDD family membrane protein YckC
VPGEAFAEAAAAAPLSRRFASLLYDALLLSALLWCAGLPFLLMEHALGIAHVRGPYQLYLASISGLYFAWQWVHGGATLAMKTWHLRIEARRGGGLTWAQALLRYVAALAGLVLFAVGFIWAFFDRDRAFLHDRIAGTHIVSTRAESMRARAP